MQRLSRNPALLFPATPVANSDPNALDDYAESSFTPTLSFATLPSGLTYVAATTWGRATKIGRNVQVNGRLTLASKGLLGAGLVTIAGLPFSPALQGTALCTLVTGATLTTATKLSGWVTTGGGIALKVESNTGCADCTWGMLGNTFDVMFAASFPV